MTLILCLFVTARIRDKQAELQWNWIQKKKISVDKGLMKRRALPLSYGSDSDPAGSSRAGGIRTHDHEGDSL